MKNFSHHAPFQALRRLGLSLFIALAAMGVMAGEAQAFSCPASQVKEGALCYAKPKAGYSCNATLCVANCPDGYRSSGIGTCHYSGTLTYPKKPFISRSHSGMQRCLALFYDDCRADYRMDVCGICAYKGAWDTLRKSYDRGPGTNPDISGAFRNISITTQNVWGRTLSGLEVAYNQTLSTFDDELKKQVLAAATKSGNAFLNEQQCLISKTTAKFKELKNNPDTNNAMKRIVVAGAKGKVDPQIGQDMLTLAVGLGINAGSSVLKDCNIPADFLATWSFGVFAQVELVAGVGQTGSIGIIANLPQNLKSIPEVRAFATRGLVFGPELVESLDVGVFLQKGLMATQNGPFMGLDFAAHVEGGGKIGMSWSLPTRLPRFDPTDVNAYTDFVDSLHIGFSLAVGTGAGGGAGMTFGYESTLKLTP